MDFFPSGDDEFAVRAEYIFCGDATNCTSFKCFHDFDIVCAVEQNTFRAAAILDGDDGMLGDVDEPTSQVTGVCGTQRGVGHTFPSTVGRHEVFQHGQTFAEVRLNGQFDDFAGWVGHQATHAGHLGQLIDVAAGL